MNIIDIYLRGVNGTSGITFKYTSIILHFFQWQDVFGVEHPHFVLDIVADFIKPLLQTKVETEKDV
jgi:hypothetical protein